MDTLAKIVYVSDKIEMNRKLEGYDLEYERELAQKDLDKTVLYIIDASIKSLVEKGKLIEKEVDTRNYLILKNLNR
jgi:HD superfamily phosphohydrolase YqeK